MVTGPDPAVGMQAGFSYRPALDGLRALAVAAVMLYHAGVDDARGGYLGVDVFFVISGYLITSLLLVEKERDGRVSLPAFWARRARRLLPALFVVLAAVAAYAALLADPTELSRIRGDALATLGYFANWRHVFSGASYFEQFGVPSPLRHTWSLAIEEQWYLLWPIACVALLRVTRGRLGVAASLAAAGAFGSALLMALLHDPLTDPSRIYYGTDTRVQGLLVGAVSAFLMARRPVSSLRGRRLLVAAGAIGGVVLVWFAARVDDSSDWMYSGGYLAVAVATALVVAAVVLPGRSLLHRALAVAPLRYVGRISYGLYLWHWPVYVTLSEERLGLGGAALLVLRLAVTAAAAVVSYHLIERPMRLGRIVKAPQARFVTPAAALVVLAVALASTAAARSLPSELPSEPLAVERPAVEDRALTLPSGQAGPPLARQAPPGRLRRILMVGDSSAFTLAYNLPDDVAAAAQWAFQAEIGCGVVRGQPFSGGRGYPRDADCEHWPQSWAVKRAELNPDLAVVQLGAWEVLDHRVGDEVLRVGTGAYARYLRSELELAVDVLSAGGARIVFLEVPCFAQNDDFGAFGRERNESQRVAAVNAILAEVVAAHAEQVALLDSAAFLCPGGSDAERIEGVRVRHDGVHFDTEGAAVFWEWLAPRLIDLARDDASGSAYPRRSSSTRR